MKLEGESKQSHIQILSKYSSLMDIAESFLKAAEEVRIHKDKRSTIEITVEIINNNCKGIKVISNV